MGTKKKKKYYAVCKGFVTGILNDWDDCKKATSGFHGAIFKSFSTKMEAFAYFKAYTDNSTAKMVYAIRHGEKPGIYESWVSCCDNLGSIESAEFKGFHKLESAEKWLGSTLTQDTDDSETIGKFYAVRDGDHPGVYSKWSDALVAIGSYRSPKYKVFSTREKAENFISADDVSQYYNDCRSRKNYYVVKRGKVPGIYTTWTDCERSIGDWDTALFKGFDDWEDAMAFWMSRDGGPKKFYAIRRGTHPGIYKSWDECMKNIGDWGKSLFRGFMTLEEAEEYMNCDSIEDEISTGDISDFVCFAVKNGQKPGIYDTWEEAKEAVKTSTDTIYKGFESREEAGEWLNNKDDSSDDSMEDLSLNDILSSKPYAFVDGSFDSEKKIYGSGGFLIYGGDRHIILERGKGDIYADMWNVGGEIKAAMEAIKIALELKLPEIYIMYDYAGIELWATKRWKANREGTKEYQRFIDNVKSLIDIHFLKVRGHSGVEGNEEADRLAKIASGLLPGYEELKNMEK